ncbi:MAG: 4Fe-4S dicluster domain-containing protein [Dehalococcoidia bacterium]|nr:4Fe-4S dicluster domain-containing protein [Dehalococcoidia bacterium]
MTQVIHKPELESWLNKIAQKKTLVAPRKVGDLIVFQPVQSAAEIELDFDNTAISPKEFFFPKTEVLFTVDSRDGVSETIPAKIDAETVIFGIRPCDARGIALLDGPFLDPPSDSLWAQHRDETTMIGLACKQTLPQCFCTSMGSAPDDASHVDIMLKGQGEIFSIEAITEKGKKLLEGARLKTGEAKYSAPSCGTDVPSKGITGALKKAFTDPYWSRLADRCLHCNMCSYLCPTCYCFDVRDRRRENVIERIRTWESCQSKGFTRIAGGHDPRAEKGSRLRQRFCHKLLYFPEQFGSISCVGCGRCVASCPVNIDIREIIRDVQELGARVG